MFFFVFTKILFYLCGFGFSLSIVELGNNSAKFHCLNQCFHLLDLVVRDLIMIYESKI